MRKLIGRVFLIGAFLFGVSLSGAFAQVIFEDNFDKQADWQPRPGTNDMSPGGASAVCDYGQSNSYCTSMPSGWTNFRSTGLWWGPTYQDTIRITSQAGRGGTGKAFMVYNESNIGASGDGWGADGQLTKLFNQDYQELYVRVWMRTQLGWNWPSVNDMIIKLIRVYHFDRSGSIYDFFADGKSAPIYLWDFKHSQKWGTRVMNTVRCDPQETNYYCGTSIPGDYLFVSGDYAIEPNGSGMLADGSWHRLDYHLKMNTYNSSTGTFNSNGIFEFWYDGKLMETHSDVQWKQAGADASTGWNTIGLGGNAYNQYSDATNKAEQWYAFDDVVVSTNPIPADYVIGSSIPFTDPTSLLPPRNLRIL